MGQHPREITLLTVEEAAANLNAAVRVAAIRQAIREGRLDAVKIGKRYFVSPDALRRFAKCRARASQPASGNEKTASGSSSTVASNTGPAALAMLAAESLLRKPSRGTSPPASRPEAARPNRAR